MKCFLVESMISILQAFSTPSDENLIKPLLPQMCHTFIPLLSQKGRIVNVSSTGSSLSQYDKEIQQRFRSSNMTLDGLEKLMQEYQVPNFPLYRRSRLTVLAKRRPRYRKPRRLAAASLQRQQSMHQRTDCGSGTGESGLGCQCVLSWLGRY